MESMLNAFAFKSSFCIAITYCSYRRNFKVFPKWRKFSRKLEEVKRRGWSFTVANFLKDVERQESGKETKENKKKGKLKSEGH